MMKLTDVKLGVVGLGYVGLPLAVEFGKKYPTVGFDINTPRIRELKIGHDSTMEVDDNELTKAIKLSYTDQLDDIADCNVYIVTVPSPVDIYNRPDLSHLIKASESIGKVIKAGDVVIYESTVYPGATEDDCLPVIESVSGLKFNVDFFAGYSPERINPGDKEHRFISIKKITSGSTPDVADFVDELYRSVVVAGTHKAPSIKVAEAAKVIENTQRDLNIALINELALIFNIMEIDTEAVLQAASSKWNFLPFRPGLVGGHCIGVDPYYLTHKAQSLGYHPEVILAGRRINDSMSKHVVSQVAQLMMRKRIHIVESRILVMGLTFKENCPDIRNSKVIDIIDELKRLNANVDIFDPWVDIDEARKEYGVELIPALNQQKIYDAVILAVGHKQFVRMGIEAIRALCKLNHIVYDVKYLFEANQVDGRI
jgi:UDP-N-acetyl-D-galactosamine dehydrogenase